MPFESSQHNRADISTTLFVLKSYFFLQKGILILAPLETLYKTHYSSNSKCISCDSVNIIAYPRKYHWNKWVLVAVVNWHHRESGPAIGESLLPSLFTFLLISIRVNLWKTSSYARIKFKSCKNWPIWAICAIFSSLQAITKEIAAIVNCEIDGWQKR